MECKWKYRRNNLWITWEINNIYKTCVNILHPDFPSKGVDIFKKFVGFDKLSVRDRSSIADDISGYLTIHHQNLALPEKEIN